MKSRMRRLLRSRILMTIVVTLLTAAVVSVGLGPMGGPRTDERFPCEDCGCGCASALECWTNCCCHTPIERARWALANDIMVPAWARRTLDAVEAVRSAIGSDVEIATLPTCCRERLLGKPIPTTNDHETCKRRPKLATGSVVLLCLDPMKSELRFVAPVVGFVLPAVDRFASLSDPEPSVPPPRR